jgi:hypothetical protein
LASSRSNPIYFSSASEAGDRTLSATREVAVLVLISFAGFLAVIYATALGAGTGPDSASYIMAARNVLSGHGLSIASPQTGQLMPMTHFPPLLSLVLAAIGFFIGDPLVAARWLNAIVFGANIFLIGYGFRRLGSSRLLSVLCACLMLTSLPMLFIHTWVLSEALFFLMAFLGLFLLADFLTMPAPWLLIALSAAFAAAWMTRYVGITLLMTAAIVLFLFSNGSLRQKIQWIAMMSLIAGLPMVAIVLRNHAVGGSMTDREMMVHPVLNMGYLWLACQRIAIWLIPSAVPEIVDRILALAVIVFAVVPMKGLAGGKEVEQSIVNLHRVVLTFVICYLAVLVATLLFFDADIRIDDRDLSPFYISGLVLIGCQCAILLSSGRRSIQWVVTAALVLSLAIATPRAIKLIVGSHAAGLGFSRKHWKESELASAIQALDVGGTTISNSTAGVYFLSGRPALALPYKVDPHTAVVNSLYSDEMDSLRDQFHRNGATFVFFKDYSDRNTEEALKKSFGLESVVETPDGKIYKAAQ